MDAAETPPAGTTLASYLRILKRRGWILVLCLILIPAAAVFFSARDAKLYQATSEIYVSHDNLASAVTGIQDATAYIDPQRAAATLANLAQTTRVANRTLAKLGLTDRSAGFLLAQTSVYPKGNSDVFSVAVTDADPGLAVRIANEYGSQIVRYRTQLDTASVATARSEAARRLQELQETGKENSVLYRGLERKDQELATLQALQTSRLSVTQPAARAYRVAPRPKRAAALGIFLGLVVGVALMFLVEALDTRVRSGSEIAERLNLPLLARIPGPPRKLASDNALVMLANPSGQHGESFRILRTNLEFALLSGQARTVLLTSAVPGEGKSTTAANLAVALARGGRRVALVDLDLRRPYLDRFFRLPRTPGITDVALGRATLVDAMTRVDLGTGLRDAPAREGSSRGLMAPGSLDVLTSGPLPPDPGEFVGTSRLSEILNALREGYDLVVIDSPPMLRVGDVMMLSTKVDALLVVSRLNLIRRSTLTELRRLLDSIPIAKLGLVLAGADGARKGDYGYGYSYDFGADDDAALIAEAAPDPEVAEARV